MTTLQCQVLAVSLALVLSKHCATWLWVISASNCAATPATSTASSFALGLTSSQPISRHILCHLTLCNTFLEHPIRAYQGLSGPIRAYQGLSGPIRAYQGLLGPIFTPIHPSKSINQAQTGSHEPTPTQVCFVSSKCHSNIFEQESVQNV